jgi:MFS family permease
MAKHNVKRIAAKSQPRPNSERGHRSLLPIVSKGHTTARYDRERLFASSASLANWGAIAGIMGGILWGILFLSLQLDELSLKYAWHLGNYRAPRELFVLPIVMFLLCLAGLFIRQENQRLPGMILRRTGFTLASLGLISLISYPLEVYWLAQWLNYPSDGLISFLFSGPVFEWQYRTSSVSVLIGIGLALFGIATIQARVLPTWVATWFVFASLASFLVPTAFGIFFTNDNELLYSGGVFAGTMLLFGAGWAMVGNALLRGRTREHSQGPYQSQRSLS